MSQIDDRIERLGRLQEALQLTGTSATSVPADPLAGDIDRSVLVKIDRGLRVLRQGG